MRRRKMVIHAIQMASSNQGKIIFSKRRKHFNPQIQVPYMCVNGTWSSLSICRNPRTYTGPRTAQTAICWPNVGPTSALSSRRWANVGPTIIAVLETTELDRLLFQSSLYICKLFDTIKRRRDFAKYRGTWYDIDDLVQDYSNTIAKALELLQSCT